MKKAKIIIVGPALSMGGMERASVNIANSLQEMGNEVIYIAMFKKAHFFKLNDGIALYEPQGFNINAMSIIKSCRWIRKTILQIKPDTVFAFNKFYAAVTILSLLGTSVKVFISERSSPLFYWRAKMRYINKLAFTLKPPAGVIAQTSVAAKYQQKYYGNKVDIKVVPNALRHVALYPDIQREKWLLAVGRFGDNLKGFDRLIEAFSKIHDKEWKLVFAGGDAYDAFIEKQLAEDLNISERILFLGKVKDIDKIYAQAGIFIIPSRSEGFPNALCEAMAAGLPCISFDFIAGPRDIITDGVDGIIVKDGNTQEMAKAIDKLITDEVLRNNLAKNAVKISERLKGSFIAREIFQFIYK